MKDDKIVMPELKIEGFMHGVDICEFFKCSTVADCGNCALESIYNFKKWQDQCKEKEVGK